MYNKLKERLIKNYKRQGFKNVIGSVESVVDLLFHDMNQTKNPICVQVIEILLERAKFNDGIINMTDALLKDILEDILENI